MNSAMDVEVRLASGPLARAGGTVIVDGLPGVECAAALLAEAMLCYEHAELQRVSVGDGATGRGGTPPRELYTSGGGPVQDALYATSWLSTYLSQICGAPMAPTGGRGSYSYYVELGHSLGLHLDIDTCDVTLISVLRDDAPPEDPAGSLLVHAEHLGASLDAVRRDPKRGTAVAKARPGQSIVLLGGLVPHETIPLTGYGPRIISALCFRAY